MMSTVAYLASTQSVSAQIRLDAPIYMKNKTLPYKVGILHENNGRVIYWPVNSRSDDEMVIGDQIPGDKKTAEICARCCNIAYRQALEDVEELLKNCHIDGKTLLESLKIS